MPPGEERGWASPRKYEVDLNAKTATEVWNFEVGQSIVCPYCSSVYEDAPKNYLLDYSFVNGGIPNVPTFAQLLGLDAAGERIFSYQYPTNSCGKIYRALPIASRAGAITQQLRDFQRAQGSGSKGV